MQALGQLNGTRFVGDSESMVVHDTWNGESEGCALADLPGQRAAVGFEPDTLGQAFNEGFDYCDYCIGTSEPDSRSGGRSCALVGEG